MFQTQGSVQRVVFPVADGAEQNGVCILANTGRMAVNVSSTAHQRDSVSNSGLGSLSTFIAYSGIYSGANNITFRRIAISLFTILFIATRPVSIAQ
jgi:hypothetical protein